jgi:hypothetical protein
VIVAVGTRPVVEKWCPVPSPNASTIAATRISDETTRPAPARRSRGAYRPACQKTSTVIGTRKRSHSFGPSQSTL